MPKKRRTAKGGYYQGMSSPAYWRQRNKESLSESFKDSDEVNKYLENRYKQGLLDFCEQYNKLLQPFVKDGKIDRSALAKAKKDKKFLAKLRRLETQIKQFSDKLGKQQQDKILELLCKTYKQNVIRNFEGFRKNPKGLELLNSSAVERAVKTPFTKDGRQFSDRIWENLNNMQGEIRRELTDSIAKGRSIQKTTARFKKIFGNTSYNTQRLIRTETIAAYSKASRDSYAAAGIKKLQVLPQAGACKVCSTAAKYQIPIDVAELGVNIPPFHPFCKCCNIPVVEW